MSSKWQALPFAHVFQDVTSKASKVDQIYFQDSGEFPIIDQGQSFIAAYLDDKNLVWKDELPVIIFGDHTRAVKYVDFPFVLGADGTKVLKPHPSLWPMFGYYALLNINIPSAGYSRHFKFLKENFIPLPPLNEQKRIATILSKADRLRRLRRYAHELSDGYLQSVFLEMFGDPVSNPRGWERATIGDVVASSQYGTSDKSNSEKQGYPVLGMGNITYSGEVDLTSLAYVELSQVEFKTLRLEPGDIIFNRTNSTELVGKTAHWKYNIDAVLASYLVKLKLQKNTLPDYFAALLNSRHYKQLFQERCKKAVGQSNISPTLLKEFPVLIPPLPLQQKFVQIVQKYERLRAQQRESARQGEYLFQSLLQRAFRGEV